MKPESQCGLGGLHPFVKLAVVGFTVALVVMRPGLDGSLLVYLPWLVLTALLVVGSKLNWKTLAGTCVIGLLLGGFLVLTQGFLYRSSGAFTPILTLFDLELGGRQVGRFTAEGLTAGLVGWAKVMAVLLSSLYLRATTKIESLAYSLLSLRVPYTLSFLLVLTMRFVYLVESTWQTVVDSYRLRGYDVDKLGVLARLRDVYVPSLAPLMLVLFKQGLQFEVTIQMRGFNATKRPTLYLYEPMVTADWVALSLVVLIFAANTMLLFG